MDGELTYQAWAMDYENELPKLKPCPFCGGEAEAVHEINGMWTVECTECGALVDGIEAWNKRAETVTVTTGITTVTDAPQITYVQERTCKFVSSKGSGYPPVCSACGYGIIVFDMEPPHYCPNCGAKVVSEWA